MKILIVSEMSAPYAIGGGEVRYGLLARELARRGHEVTWLSMRQRASADHEVIDGVRHLHRGPRIKLPPARPMLSMLRFTCTVFLHVLSHRYDVIDAQTYAPLPSVWLACFLSRQKMTATIHDVSRGRDGQWMSNSFGRLIALAEALLYRLPYPNIIAVSRSTADALVARWGVKRKRIHVIPNGLEMVSVDKPLCDRDIDLMYAGRFVQTKNIQDLIAIADICFKAGAIRKVVLVGDGPLLETMKTRVKNMGLSDVIEFAGQRSNLEVLELLRRAKLFFHTSSREGFPVVMIEAMTCQTPIVAYNIPGVVDVIEHEKTGLLVAERDTSQHAQACMALLASDAKRLAMGTEGRTRVAESLTIEKMTDRVLQVYAD